MNVQAGSVRILNHHLNAGYALLAVADVAMFMACAISGPYVYRIFQPAAPLPSAGELAAHSTLFAALSTLAMVSMGLYEPRRREGVNGVVIRVVCALALSTAAMGLFEQLLPLPQHLTVGKGALSLTLACAFAVALGNRLLHRRMLNLDAVKRRVLILGHGSPASTIALKMRRRTDREGFTIVGYISLAGERSSASCQPSIIVSDSLPDLILQHRIDEIVVAVAQPLDDLMRYQLSRCRELGACITDIVNFFEREAGKILLEGADRGLFAEDPVFSCEGEKEPAGKRAFDLMAAFCLLALFWPLMLLAALAIWIEDGSGAPVLYRQRRVGRDGRFFDVVKFRTMSVNAESDGQARWAAKRDPRITRVGSFLRRTRIDELPQIFNVLVGEMALVGPRPERPEFVRELSRKIPHYAQRHCVKPGITGWAQTHYPYGSCETDAANKTEFDLYYVKNRSLFLDALVLLQTVEIILFAKGAR